FARRPPPTPTDRDAAHQRVHGAALAHSPNPRQRRPPSGRTPRATAHPWLVRRRRCPSTTAERRSRAGASGSPLRRRLRQLGRLRREGAISISWLPWRRSSHARWRARATRLRLLQRRNVATADGRFSARAAVRTTPIGSAPSRSFRPGTASLKYRNELLRRAGQVCSPAAKIWTWTQSRRSPL